MKPENHFFEQHYLSILEFSIVFIVLRPLNIFTDAQYYYYDFPTLQSQLCLLFRVSKVFVDWFSSLICECVVDK